MNKLTKLTIIKKNRVYFDCKTAEGRTAKLKITKESEDLSEGVHELLLEDISIRSKYGINLIYSIAINSENTEDRIFLKAPYNSKLVKKCRKLGGKFDKEESIWIFPASLKDEVEELESIYC